jgi:hypothetical protein
MRRISWLVTILLFLSLCACASTVPLPTMEMGGWGRCVGLDGVLRGSADDPRVAWAEIERGQSGRTRRIELVWPTGYTARFTPRVEILDPSRHVRYVEGDLIAGGCRTGPGFSGPLYVTDK